MTKTHLNMWIDLNEVRSSLLVQQELHGPGPLVLGPVGEVDRVVAQLFPALVEEALAWVGNIVPRCPRRSR